MAGVVPAKIYHILANFSSTTLTTSFQALQKKIAVGCLPSTHQTTTTTTAATATANANFKNYTETCASLLKACADRNSTTGGRAIHGHTIKTGVSSDRSVLAKLLTMYSNCCRPTDCEKVLEETNGFDLFSWNTTICAYVRHGDLERACQLFDTMPRRNDVSWTVMMDGHMKCGRVQDSVVYFEKNPYRSIISWTAAISGFVQNGLNSEALMLFRRMLGSHVMPNEITYTSVIRACIGEHDLDLAQSVVGLIVKTGFEQHLSVCNSLITLHVKMRDFDSARRVFERMEERDVVTWTAVLDVYIEMGKLKDARQIFDAMPAKNEVSWSTMIARYSQGGDAFEALRLFDRMICDGFKPNISCFSSVLSASASLKNLLLGNNVHGHIIKIGIEGNVFIGCTLIDMYCKCGESEKGRQVFDMISEKNTVCWNSMIAGYGSSGSLEEAEKLFMQIPTRNIVSWNALISGYVENKQYEKVLEIFGVMLVSRQMPNQTTFSSVLRACACFSSLEKGKNLHGKIVKLGIQNQVFMGTALTDMYAKSGDIKSSKKVFSRMPEKNAISWTAMIQGLADNGLAEESLALFEEMERKTAIVPTESMFLSILFACSHCKLVEKGFQYFESMKKVYGIIPLDKHYTCMVDLLARAGRLREAEKLINKMPMRPEANSWAALLSACSTYRNDEIGERAAKKLWELEKDNSASYVLLSNIYASAGRWKDVLKTRTMMGEAGLKKCGGCSWIQVRDQFFMFFSWDVHHEKSLEICGILELLMSEMMAQES